jgi:hypothetical protein
MLVDGPMRCQAVSSVLSGAVPQPSRSDGLHQRAVLQQVLAHCPELLHQRLVLCSNVCLLAAGWAACSQYRLCMLPQESNAVHQIMITIMPTHRVLQSAEQWSVSSSQAHPMRVSVPQSPSTSGIHPCGWLRVQQRPRQQDERKGV